MTTQRDLAESLAHSRRRLVCACFASAADAEGLDARRSVRLLAGGVALAFVLVAGVAARTALVDGGASSRPAPTPGGVALSPSPTP